MRSSERGEQIVAAARRYMDCPFLHQGRSRDGMDCIGLMWLTARDIGIRLEDCRVYTRCPNPRTLLREIGSKLDPVERGAEMVGDIAVFWFNRELGKLGHELPQHVGFLSRHPTGVPAVIHTNARVGRVVETIMGDEWGGRIHSWWRLRG